ncbi:MAG TPA: bifunctional diaminohydroxyphosphoribosylaminopyrimidine deaminase/5-amino-6-(5-phosphoribosylamino)uracil reductase RibD [Ignavibacteria bacterium]
MNNINNDEILMKKCITLAKRGAGLVSPNPLVGCIIYKSDKIIGQGYHKKYGDNHAEINAINDAISSGNNLKGSTLYVNLEPCSHFGKTPPCVTEIIKQKIKKIYIGIEDPNPLVNGESIKLLVENGIEVFINVLEKECKELNKFFIKFISNKKPYITLKIAQSIDGKIALYNHQSKYITSEKSRDFVRKLRAHYDGILIGKNTAKYDNPHLTTHGKFKNNPKRFVFDRNLKLNPNLTIFRDENKLNTYRLTSDRFLKHDDANSAYFREKKNRLSINEIIKYFYRKKITSILVEGGADIFSQFIHHGLFDDIYFIVAPKIIGKGISPFDNFCINDIQSSKVLKYVKSFQSDKDLIIYYTK